MTDVGIPKEFAEECSRHESNKLLYITYKEEANLTCKVSMYSKKTLYTGQFFFALSTAILSYSMTDVLGIESILCK